MALKGIKVVELAGLAPAPFCGMVLADFGATVIRIDKVGSNVDFDCLGNGKKSLALNLKHPEGVNILKTLCKSSDVLIEPFRKGVMEKLKLGPDVLLKNNSRLIYARLSGYGHSGTFSDNSGHDINYVALSGLLSLFGRKGENPIQPVNIVADFGGGGLMCALGIVLALFERNSSGLGQVVDNAMVNGAAYLGSWLYRSQKLPTWGKQRGENLLDTGTHFYEVYKTKDGKYMSVGALEPQFYAELLQGLGMTDEEAPQFGDFCELKKKFAEIFLKKDQREWCEIFDNTDACVAPVLELDEAPNHPHNISQNTFTKTELGEYYPNPAPVLGRTPGVSKVTERAPQCGEHTRMILDNLGYSPDVVDKLANEKAIGIFLNAKM